MPFTFSHAVLAPPIAKLSGNRLPIAALAIGCMTPDLYRILLETEVQLNHQWRGLIHPDLWVGLLFCFLWYCLYRPMLFKLFGVVAPLNIHSFSAFIKFLCSTILAILLGITTHIIWDGFTHLDFRTIAFHHTLSQPISIMEQNYPLHRILQIGTSIIALPFLIWMSLDYFHKYRQPSKLSTRFLGFTYLLFIVSFFAGCFSYIHRAKSFRLDLHPLDLYHFIGFFLNGFARGALISFTIGCILFIVLEYLGFFRKKKKNR